MREFVVAVDVGTGSARSGVFDRSGQLLARTESPIAMRLGEKGRAEHDSEDIWAAVGRSVRAALAGAGVVAAKVAAIGFDATCSLVVRGANGERVSVSADGDTRWDTFVWMDHRAVDEAEECTATGHVVLDSIGGAMSPEMQTPKLMWLKRHLPRQWSAAGHFFDLADFLTWRATGSTARSQCTLTAKWTYLAHEGGWRRDFFDKVGLGDVLERGKLPEKATPTGTAIGLLAADAAAELGLDDQCIVATGLIDAFAGAIGAICGFHPDRIERHVALIAGTSNCVMGLTKSPIRTSGIWGPYYGATLPGMWHWEGGQSATGALLDHILRLFGQGREPDRAAHDAVARRIGELRLLEGDAFARGIHVMPDFHGNRSPFADPRATGAIFGLTLDQSFDTLCRVYWRTAVAIALGLRHIIEHLATQGFPIDTLHITGGHRRNPVLMELYPDVTRCALVEPETEDAVLLGAAITAACAAGWSANLAEAARSMTRPVRRTIAPCPDDRYRDDFAFLKAYHESPLSRMAKTIRAVAT